MTPTLLDKLDQVKQPQAGEIAVPGPETVGFFIRWVRGLKNWKQSTLADFAQVSVSTIERAERGEKISDECLELIGRALGYGPGYFTAPRRVKTQDEAFAALAGTWGQWEPIDVRPFRTQAQVRELAKCHAYLLHRPGVEETFESEIAALWEWLDLTAFIINEPNGSARAQDRRREIYQHTLGCVQSLERRGVTVLCGTVAAPQPSLPEWKVALIAITPKLTDPGAPKRRTIFVDLRCCALPGIEDDAP